MRQMTNISGLPRLSRFACLALIPITSTVFAQATETEGQGNLAEVIVTAERRSVALQDTNLAISAMDAESIESKSIEEISDLQNATPSLSIIDTGFSKSLNIRGIGLAVVSPALVPGVATYRDGVFLPTQTTYGEPLFDIASIEVLRGPQGTYAGQSATAGAVFITTQSPQLSNETSGHVSLDVGNFGNLGMRGAVNVPIADTLAARLAINTQRRDSFFDNVGSEFTQPGKLRAENIRLGLLWKPTEQFQALWKTQYNQSTSDGLAWKPIPGTAFAPLAPANPFTLNYDRQDTRYDSEYIRTGLQLEFTTMYGLRLRSVTGYQYNDERLIYDNDASSSTQQWSSNNYVERMFTQDLSIISPDAQALRWVVGTTYSYYTDNIDIYRSTPTVATVNKIYLPKESWGAFATTTYGVTSQLDVEVGARYSGDRVSYNGFIQNTPPGTRTATDFLAPNGEELTGKVALNWKVTDDHLLFAFWAKGYKPGGVNSNGVRFDPETVDDFELGWKGSLFDDAVRLQVNGFYMDYVGFQTSTFDPITTLTATRNVGKSEIRGIEASAQMQFSGWRLDAGGSYIQSEMGEVSLVNTRLLPRGSAAGLGPQCAAGVQSSPPLCFDYRPATVSLEGSDNVYSPEVTFNVGVEYRLDVGSAELTPRVDLSYIGRQWASLFQDPQFDLLESRTLLNAQIAYESMNWRAQLYATNLTDETYISGTSGNNLFFGAPRQFGVRVTREF